MAPFFCLNFQHTFSQTEEYLKFQLAFIIMYIFPSSNKFVYSLPNQNLNGYMVTTVLKLIKKIHEQTAFSQDSSCGIMINRKLLLLLV